MNEYSQPISTTDGEYTQFTQIQYVVEKPQKTEKFNNMMKFLL